jgi:hypothetical protein
MMENSQEIHTHVEYHTFIITGAMISFFFPFVWGLQKHMRIL